MGVTSLILAAKGNVWAQFLMILFSVLYGAISFRFRYWGEMMTYLGMSLPMAVWSAVTWLKNPSAGNGSEAAIRRLEKRQALIVAGLSVLVTGAFYFILRWFRMPNLAFSTVSVALRLRGGRSAFSGDGRALCFTFRPGCDKIGRIRNTVFQKG